MESINKIDICIVTYNRLAYLQNCIWSILASTKVDYRLIVVSDCSTDGTNEWLSDMKKWGKIDIVVINEDNRGSAESFNTAINMTETDWFVMSCDDMWFHRGWDDAVVKIVNDFDDCGIATFFNFPILDTDTQLKKINEYAYYRQSTGLGSSLINKQLYDAVGGFYIPEGIKMGYFARGFCKKAAECQLKRKKQYLTIPEYSVQMDRNNPGVIGPPPKLHQEYLYTEYNKRRTTEKNKFKSI